MLSDYDEVIPVVEKAGIGLAGRDASHIDGGSLCGAAISDEFEGGLCSADTVLLTDEISDMGTCPKLLAMIKNEGKGVILCGDFSELGGIEGENVESLSHPGYTAEVKPDGSLSKIRVPVVVVMGQGQQCNKFDIQLGLRAKLLGLGYNVAQVGTKLYSPLFGFHALPQLPALPLWKKIMLYNRFFREVVDREDPDVLIVGAPGGIMPINEWHNELFGETAIAVSKSLSPDVTVMSTYLFDVDDSFMTDTRNYLKYALGAPLDHLHLSNTRLYIEQDMKTISYMRTNYSDALGGQGKTSASIFNVFSTEASDAVYESIVMQLQGNIEVL